jgi:hypothetical protein
MISVDYPYCKFSPDFNVCNCDEPCLSVTLKSGGNELTVVAMVDSGCTMTHANADLAGELGIDLRTCILRKSVGISGEAEDAWMTEVVFSFSGLGQKRPNGRLLSVEEPGIEPGPHFSSKTTTVSQTVGYLFIS